jgi:protein disulfide-isomerase A1
MEYNGGRTENEIVNWILKKAGPVSTEATCDELKKKTEQHKLVLAYFGDKSSEKAPGIYLEVAQTGSVSEKYQFVHINDKECATAHGATEFPTLVLFRQFDESPLHHKVNWETTPIVDWLLASSTPTLIEFSEDYIEPIFGQKQSAIFLFRSKDDADSSWAKEFEKAAHELKG